MAVTLKQNEAATMNYPLIDSSYLKELKKTRPVVEKIKGADDWIWQRIEGYTAYRWKPRVVVWTVEGGGEWEPPLAPTTITKTEVWLPQADWGVVQLLPSPLGGLSMPCIGPYRITADVGGGDIPAAVLTAARRLSEYCIYQPSTEGPQHWATSLTQRGAGENASETSFARNANWVAKAMQNSGAADLLRPYRRV